MTFAFLAAAACPTGRALHALVITEIMYHPPEAVDGPFEYIEIYNEIPDPQDLSGYILCNGVAYEFPRGTWLDGRQFLVLASNVSSFQSKYGAGIRVLQWTSGSLDNAGERIEICNAAGRTIVEVGYNDRGKWVSGADGTGHSLEITSPFVEVDDPDHWVLSNARGGSPGAANPCWEGVAGCTPRVAVVINEGLFRTAGERWIELYNRGPSPVNISGYYLTDDPAALNKAQIPPSTSIASGARLTYTDTELGLDFSIPAPGTRIFVALVESNGTRVVDAYNFEPAHDELSEARIPDGRDFADAATPARDTANSLDVDTSVVINEIMYHPIDNDSGKEYVELYNRGAVAVELTGWVLSEGLNFAFPAGTMLGSGAYLVVARNPVLVRGIYGLPASMVIGPQQTSEALAAFGQLRDGGERITLLDELGRTVDTVRYHDGGEWPAWADGGGSSLELIDVNQDNNIGQAWDASDDSAKAQMQTFSYVGRHRGGESELAIALLDAGMTVVDDVMIIGDGFTVTDTPIVNTGETWRYFKGTQAPPANWNTQGFSDGSWLSAVTGIGYGDADDATELTDMQNGYMTIFCRKTFNLANPGSINELWLSVTIDDGFYAYLNGSQVGSYNVAGTAFDAASPTPGEPTLIEIDLTGFKNLLVAGSNVLAIQVHNAGLGSTDLSFNPSLVNRTRTPSGGANLVQNGTFESNTSGWIIDGTHFRSARTTQNPLAGAGSLKIIASGRGDNKANRIETPSGTTGLGTLPVNQDLAISLKTRWIVGAQTLLTNGYNHGMAKAHNLAVPSNLGTPGARNSVTSRLISQTGGSNLGPVIREVKQSQAVPGASEAVVVTVRVSDADGVSAVTLRYALNNPSSSPTAVAMTHQGGGLYQGTIPGQALGTKVVFFIDATDAVGRPGRYPVDITARSHPLIANPPTAGLNDLRYCLYRHDTRNPSTNFQNFRFVMTDSDETFLTNRARLSNDLIDGSFVFGGSSIYHESHTRFSGSPWARGSWNGSFRVVMPKDKPLHGRITRCNLDDRHGTVNCNERLGHYLLRQHNGSGTVVPYYEPLSMVRWQVNARNIGNREFVQTPNNDYNSFWFPDDDDGDFLEMDDRFLIDDAGANRVSSADGRVLHPPPYSTNDTNGTNEENYRWFFGLRAKEGADDFTRFMDFTRIMDPGDTNNTAFDQVIFDVCDVEQFLRNWSVRFNISDWDEWGAERGKNCYFYRPPTDGRWRLYAWDMELTYETGRLDQFLIPTSPTSDFNPGGFAEANRFLNRPRAKRLHYAILDEMVNGPDRWFHSSFLSTYMSKLASLGMSNTAIGQPGGYIDQRFTRLQSRIQSVVYPQVRLTITTNSGNNFTTDQLAVNLAGNAPVEVHLILVNGDEFPLAFPGLTTWSLTGIQLAPGPNVLNLIGYDLKGNLVDSDSITVTSTAGPLPPPVISSLNPSSSAAGTNIQIIGSDFHNGVRVFFGGVESTNVAYDENGPTPNTIVARVPSGTGTVTVTVRNFDNQTSNGMSFTFVLPPPMFVRGDANGDTIVDVSDGVKCLLHIFGGAPSDCEDAVDANNDEQLNGTDAVYLLNYLFANGPTIPAPFPVAGADPSGSALGCSR